MTQIALTRHAVVAPGALREAVVTAALEPLRRGALWRAQATFLATVLAVLLVLCTLLDLAVWLAPTAAVVVTTGRLGWFVGSVARGAFRIRSRDLAPGATLAAGVAPGVLRLAAADDDVVMRTSQVHDISVRGGTVVLVGSAEGLGVTTLPRALLDDDDLAVLRRPSAAVLPGRVGETVPLTHEVFLDEGWRQRCAGAYVAHAVRSAWWWTGIASTALAAVLVTVILRDASIMSVPTAGAMVATMVTSTGLGLVERHRSGLKAGTPPPQGIRLAAGTGPDGLRLLTEDSDLLFRSSAIAAVRTHGDVVHVSLHGAGTRVLPREVLDENAVARLDLAGTLDRSGRAAGR